MRRQVGVVLQDPFLFSGTVAENIRYAKPGASHAEVVQAARLAQVHDFVMDFPDGFETRAGEQGQRLSGGERQRISIACAILHDPRILILDEATTAQDLETEERIHMALANLTAGLTVIAIAHRLATLHRAQRLVVMEAGRVAETGTHRRLMAAGELFLRMVEAQRNSLMPAHAAKSELPDRMEATRTSVRDTCASCPGAVHTERIGITATHQT